MRGPHNKAEQCKGSLFVQKDHSRSVWSEPLVMNAEYELCLDVYDDNAAPTNLCRVSREKWERRRHFSTALNLFLLLLSDYAATSVMPFIRRRRLIRMPRP